MALNNETILVNAYLQGTNDFQQRLPYPTQANITKFTETLFDPYNNDLYNTFVNLMNMIAFSYVQGRRFDNPYAEFKKERITAGKTIREIAPKWFRAHTFNPDNETLLKLEKPEFEQWFYTVNRQDQYEFSWIKEELMFAIDGADGFGLNRLLAATMDALISSDNYDEMRAMLALFKEANDGWNKPIFNYQLSKIPDDENTAKEFLQAVRKFIYALTITPSKLYNAVDVPVYAKPEELILLVTPTVRAVTDVQALAAAFNLGYAAAQTRIITVPEDAFGISDTAAILTTVDFFECRDYFYGVEAAPYNPANMSNKYYLQHWELIAANPLVPIIRFSTDATTESKIISQTTTGFSLKSDKSVAELGGVVQLMPHLEGDINSETKEITVAPDSCVYSVSGEGLNTKTYVDRLGKLHIQKTGLVTGDTITVTGTATYKNPSEDTNKYTDNVTITIE